VVKSHSGLVKKQKEAAVKRGEINVLNKLNKQLEEKGLEGATSLGRGK